MMPAFEQRSLISAAILSYGSEFITWPQARSRSLRRTQSDFRIPLRQETDCPNRSRKVFKVKKPDRIQLARQIIERVKKEMQEPRLTESVRNSMRGKIAHYSSEPAIKLEKV